MEKTYNGLIERLARAYYWHLKCAEDMERQPGLLDCEKQYIIENRAIAKKLKTILDAEEADICQS